MSHILELEGVFRMKISVFLLAVMTCLCSVEAHTQIPSDSLSNTFLSLFTKSKKEYKSVLKKIDNQWDDSYIPFLLDAYSINPDPVFQKKILNLLQEKTGQKLGKGYYDWLRWMWTQSIEIPPQYLDYKAEIYKYVDPRFEKYFKGRSEQLDINIDEVLWGGVEQDGIPPLRMPTMIEASDAKYLRNNHIVFGFYINGEAKAYPKRILGWHEFVVDRIGERMIAGVYCTLCGTVIAYDMHLGDRFFDLGTSGFLYRSNKLMYDKSTQSLWNTIEGKPVIGPLVGQGLQLKMYPVVTTTWQEWKELHPDTKVLSIDTGHDRDYSEGSAYRFYYLSDRLMFPVPKTDDRLKNKSSVYVIRDDRINTPWAISKDYLKKSKFHQTTVDDIPIVVIVTDKGAIRTYELPNAQMKIQEVGKEEITDMDSNKWQIEEMYLSHGDTQGKRIIGHEVFWFAWQAMFPETILVK